MSYGVIRSLLETRLNTISADIDTAFENVKYTPRAGVPYQAVSIIPGETANPTFGDDFKRELGVFQVTVLYPSHAGPAQAQARADLVKAAFVRGLTLVSGAVRVLVNRSPAQSRGAVAGAWFQINVSVPFYADIQP